MTELEKMQRTKMHIEKMANGINPIDDSYALDSDMINNLDNIETIISDISNISSNEAL